MAKPCANLAAASASVRPPETAAPTNPVAVTTPNAAAVRRPPNLEEMGPAASAAASWPRLLMLADRFKRGVAA